MDHFQGPKVEDASYQPEENSSQQSLLTIPEDKFLSLRARWKEAVERWEKSLVDNTYRKNPHSIAIKEFRSWEDLVTDLKRRQAEASPTGLQSFIYRVMPTMSNLARLFPLFAAAISIPGNTRETGLVWAVLYLGVKAAGTPTDRSSEVLKLTDRLETKLEQFNSCSALLIKYSRNEETGREIASAIVDMFEAVINFWVEAVVALKSDGALKKLWPSFDIRASEAYENVKQAVERVQYQVDMLGRVAALRVPLIEDEIEATFLTVDRTNFPCICLPARRSVFCGRQDDIDSIKDHLRNSTLNDKQPSFAIYGMPGVGKTSVALQFGYLCADNAWFDAVIWIRAENKTSCKQSFTDTARRLELLSPGGTTDHDANHQAVMTWLRKTKRSWILIYDNVENIDLLKQYLPETSAPGPVLVTTRYSHVAYKVPGNCDAKEILTFSDEETLQLLKAFREKYHQGSAPPEYFDLTPQDVEGLPKMLGGLALGIEHIAAYIENDRLTVTQFIEKYKRLRAEVHKRGDTSSNAPSTISALWELPLEKIEKETPDAYRLLQVLAFLSPDRIPAKLFSLEESDDWEEFPEDLCDYSELCESYEILEKSIAALAGSALIRRIGDDISVHRLLQQVVYDGLSTYDRQKIFYVAARLVNFAFPKQVGIEPMGDRWDDCRDYIEHAQALAALFDQESKKRRGKKFETSPELQELMTNASWYLYESGEHQAADSLIQKGQAMCPDPDKSLRYAHLCNTAAVIYFDTNNLKESERMHRRCLKLRTELLADNDPILSGSYINLGQVYSAQGKMKDATDMFDKYKSINAQAGIPEMVQTRGLARMIFGRASFVQGDFKSARKLYDESKSCLVEAFGDSSVLLGYLMLCYGNLEMSENDILKAQEAYLKGYEMGHEHAPTHALTAAFHYKLGQVQHILGNHRKALSHCKSGLAIVELRKLRGDMARLLYLKSLCLQAVLSHDPDGTLVDGEEEWDREDPHVVMNAAETEKIKLLKEFELQDIDGMEEADVYDLLVCAYQR